MATAVAIGSLFTMTAPAAQAAPTFTPLYWFGPRVQGQVFGALGLSGETLYCASLTAHGAVFQLTPPASGKGLWTPEILHLFNGNDGDSPAGALLVVPATTKTPETIFGTTEYDQGGTVFRLTAPANPAKPWALSTLHTFSEFTTPDRANPFSGVIADRLVPGRLLGVAPLGGPTSGGTVYALTPPATAGGAWTETVLVKFKGTNGGEPVGPLIQDTDGTVYGTTRGGGKNTYGTVFQLSPPAGGTGPWKLTTLYNFAGQADGGFPSSSLTFDSTRQHIFGVSSVTLTGYNGAVFRLTRPAAGSTRWAYAQIHVFANDGIDGSEASDDSAAPGVVADKAGNLYGVAVGGGQGGLGNVFKLTKPATENGIWTETILHAFNGKDGGAPFATLTLGPKGELYGTTTYGGPTGYRGGVFEVTP
jgi:hypothetical protein